MKKLFVFLAIISGLFSKSFGQNPAVIEVGDKAPLFQTFTDEGTVWNLNDYIGKKNIVLYFYPAAMTGGCTKQACAYRDHQAEIETADALVVGISGDNVDGLKLFKKAENLNFPLLSDESGEIASKYGVPLRDGGTITREIEGKSFDLVRGKTASRWTFIVNKEGKVAYKNEQVDAAQDAENVLQFIKNNL
jgi:peroxiredoxin Q/BCP